MSYTGGLFHGAVVGIADASKDVICVKEDTSQGDLVELVAEELPKRVELWEKPAVYAVRDILSAKYPCDS